MEKKSPKHVEEILNASVQEIAKWEKYGECIPTKQILEEVIAEQVMDALENFPWRVPILQKGSLVEMCYKMAASSNAGMYEDSLHSQFMDSEGKIQIQVYLPEIRPVESKAEVLVISQEGKEWKIPVDIIQDKEDVFLALGTVEEWAKKMADARQTLGVSSGDCVDVELLVYWKEQGGANADVHA